MFTKIQFFSIVASSYLLILIHMGSLIYNKLAELYPLWRSALLNNDEKAQQKQGEFLKTALPKTDIKTIIDLGGGVGTHSIPLSQAGYKVSIFDASKEALKLVNQKTKLIKTYHSKFEKINLAENFDSAICMWSTINYLLTHKDRKHFITWIKNHTNKYIIIDQANFLIYPKIFSAQYESSDSTTKLKITRDWEIKKQTRKTNYLYEITGKDGKLKIIKDKEIQYFMTLDEIIKLIGKGWATKYILGDYDVKTKFNFQKSHRLITVFEKSK